jgi:chorismate mutase
MEALSHLRRMIASLDEALVDALGARSRLGFDPAFYSLPADALPGLDGLDGLAGAFADAATPAGRVRVLRPAFLLGMLPGLCAGAPDNGPAPCLAADAACLDALARRLALSVHVATRKREAVPESLQAALKTRDPARIEAAITHAGVERDVLSRVRARAGGPYEDPGLPDRIAQLYADWIIPLSRKIQVYGLLADAGGVPPPPRPRP